MLFPVAAVFSPVTVLLVEAAVVLLLVLEVLATAPPKLNAGEPVVEAVVLALLAAAEPKLKLGVIDGPAGFCTPPKIGTLVAAAGVEASLV